MIVLTMVADETDLFVNPSHIVAILDNEDGDTDIVCVDQTVFVVKESPLTVLNMIRNQIN